MTAGSHEVQQVALGTENQPDLQSRATFKIIAPKATNAQPGVKMRFAKTGLQRIKRTGNFATTRPGQPANVLPEPP